MTDTMTSGVTHSATLSVEAMLDELKQRNLVREDQYPMMFGLDRHKITLPRLERGIDAASVLSDSDLIRLKAVAIDLDRAASIHPAAHLAGVGG